MTKITYAPMDELVIHEVIEMTKDDIMRERVTPQGTMPLYWCDGFLFSFSSLPMTDDVIKDYLRGRLHWLEVHYTRMDRFVPILSLDEEEYKAKMNIRIIDTTFSQIHKDFAKWLKANTKK
jgi:hypothetical protein